MGRYAYFNTGLEFKFGFAVQPSSDILEWGGFSRNSFDEETGMVQWDADVDISIIEHKFAPLIDIKELSQKYFSKITPDLKGSEKLYMMAFDDSFEESFLREPFYLLGFLIYHQLQQCPKLVARFEQ